MEQSRANDLLGKFVIRLKSKLIGRQNEKMKSVVILNQLGPGNPGVLAHQPIYSNCVLRILHLVNLKYGSPSMMVKPVQNIEPATIWGLKSRDT